MNQGFGKDFYRKGNSLKRFGPFTEPPDSGCCPHPLPENRLLAKLALTPILLKSVAIHLPFLWRCACVTPVTPYSAILRYYRCDIARYFFREGSTSPKWCDTSVRSFTKAHLYDTLFCNISRDNCAIPHKSKHERVLRYLADVSDFFFFFCFGGGEREEESEAKRGVTFIWKQREGGGVFPSRGGGVVHTGAGRVSRGGAGAKFVFSGPKCPPS